MTNNKITIDEVADMLGASNIPPEIDYRIKECATKGCVAVVYFYEDKLNDQDQKTTMGWSEWVNHNGGIK
tara:strand:+ start:2187 stop:2396 length:210 start_codon:yes stop_codon:yes gene_type:complete